MGAIMPETAMHPLSKQICYEQPLHERVRTFMRLEFLFSEARHALEGESPWDSRNAVFRLLEILSLLGRGELRTDVIKELERHAAMLARLRDNPGVDEARLTALLGEIDARVQALHGAGSLTQPLREHEFLNTIRNRASIPGGTCEFDLPSYHFWLSKPIEARRTDIDAWLGTLEPLRRALRLILNLIRNSAGASDEVATGGMYQMTLDSGTRCHLIRILLPADAPWYPEISGSKHRFSVRFLEYPELAGRPVQSRDDVPFRLVCCVF